MPELSPHHELVVERIVHRRRSTSDRVGKLTVIVAVLSCRIVDEIVYRILVQVKVDVVGVVCAVDLRHGVVDDLLGNQGLSGAIRGYDVEVDGNAEPELNAYWQMRRVRCVWCEGVVEFLAGGSECFGEV